MKQLLLLSLLLLFVKPPTAEAQKLGTLTVEKIMRDPKTWLGTSPSNIFWSNDSKTIYFDWNPDKNLSDSVYSYSLSGKKIAKVSPPTVKSYQAKTEFSIKTMRLKPMKKTEISFS